MNPLLKGDRYSAPALPGHVAIDTPIPFDSTKVYTDPDEAIEDPDEQPKPEQ